MMYRLMFVLGTALLALAAGLYFTQDEAMVTIDEPEELLLPAGTITPLTLRIHNPKRRVVRVIGLAGC
jgi:hypothetical protein